jgi:5-methylcytosine-specific restriction enzyme A
MKTHVLTWNPDRFANWNNAFSYINNYASGEYHRTRWGSGSTKSIVKGDRVFLLKQGVDPKGIIASGRADSDCYEADHWDRAKAESGVKANYIDDNFDRILNPTVHLPLSTASFTSGPLTAVYCHLDASGSSIPDEVALELEDAWKAHWDSLPPVPPEPVKPRRNPPWQRDELILVLDLEVRNGGKDLGVDHPEMIELCDCLNRLPIHDGMRERDSIRSPDDVILKLMNFRRFDLIQTGGGLSQGNKLEREVWELYAGNPELLRQIAEAIRAGSRMLEAEFPETTEDDDEGCPEGKVLYRLHRMRERDKSVIEKAKKRAKTNHGRLACVICGFDFSERYGLHGEDFIEGHHTKPVSTLPESSVTNVSDIALVCSNCHRMIHHRQPWLTVEALKSIYRN